MAWELGNSMEKYWGVAVCEASLESLASLGDRDPRVSQRASETLGEV